MRFCDIIGHEELKRRLVASVDEGRVSHAQLFTGSAGSGTLALAVAYTQYLHCTARHDGDSCGECPSCHQIAALAHPDLHLVFPVNKQGKKPTNGLVANDFINEFRTLWERSGGYFSAQQWYDTLDLGKTLKGSIAVRVSLFFECLFQNRRDSLCHKIISEISGVSTIGGVVHVLHLGIVVERLHHAAHGVRQADNHVMSCLI